MKARDHPLALQILQVLRLVTCLPIYVVAITILILIKVPDRRTGKIRITIAEVEIEIIETITIAAGETSILFPSVISKFSLTQNQLRISVIATTDLEEEVTLVVTITKIIVVVTIKTVFFFLNCKMHHEIEVFFCQFA